VLDVGVAGAAPQVGSRTRRRGGSRARRVLVSGSAFVLSASPCRLSASGHGTLRSAFCSGKAPATLPRRARQPQLMPLTPLSTAISPPLTEISRFRPVYANFICNLFDFISYLIRIVTRQTISDGSLADAWLLVGLGSQSNRPSQTARDEEVEKEWHVSQPGKGSKSLLVGTEGSAPIHPSRTSDNLWLQFGYTQPPSAGNRD
jgi:hypothetical protein